MHRSIYVPIATLSENLKAEAPIGLGRERVVAPGSISLGEDRGKCGFPLLSIIPSAPLLLEDFPFP